MRGETVYLCACAKKNGSEKIIFVFSIFGRRRHLDIREFLKKNILLFDGAMGTYYADLYRDTKITCEQAVFKTPDKIRHIHDEYVKAGCRAIKTDTFSANIFSCEGDDKALESIIVMAMAVANAAAGEDCFVFADIGPISEEFEEGAADAYIQVADMFIRHGAKNFLFETFDDADCIIDIAEYIKKRVPDAFIITSFAVQPDGYTHTGSYLKDLHKKVLNCDAIDVFGMNCASGVTHILELLKKAKLRGKMLSVMPNAGYPRVIRNRVVYNGESSYFANKIAEIAREGVSIIGGCCGTAPKFIGDAAEVLEEIPEEVRAAAVNAMLHPEDDDAASNLKKKVNVKVFQSTPDGKNFICSEDNEIMMKLFSGERIIAVELDSPKSVDSSKFLAGASEIRDAGADAITLADCPNARVRMDSSLMACKLKREYGINAIPHMTCRDRNINASKALLLGLYSEGIRNVLAVTGDPIPTAERDEVKSVYQFNSRKFASYISSLNETEFENPFTVCGALNVNVKKFNLQLDIAKQKIENGMSVFFTQPVMTEDALNNLKLAREHLDAKILGGIIPVVSERNAMFMNAEISGITVDEKIVEMYRDKTKEECTRLAVDVSLMLAQRISPYVDGFYLMTPFYRTDIMVELIRKIRELKL